MDRLNIRPALRAQERLEALIRFGGLQPGDKIPAERDLSERWGISRSAVRSAIGALIAEHKLSSRQGAGTYVAEPRVIRNLRDLRPFADVTRRLGRTMTTTVLSWETLTADMELADRLDLDAGEEVFRLARVRAIDATPAAVEYSFVSARRFPGLDRRYSPEFSLYETLQRDYGVEVVSGYQRVTVGHADAETARLLQIELGEALFALNGVANDYADRPVEAFAAQARSDYVGFASELERRR
ncbi:GntR family transcriptional regulator [Actinoallomurus rhizosphaericola]|uniref:GntR family transcriptional regulator n=1 Tax=Actinoallomurus rhizosphaericola TaxID=2952536 RepID=UPI002093856A|nr:GntR family transcriptional regulator [Actinoallomurus rhizosphaericola]MCO5997902.1 GntR family transcriptional regulator [Actinoallomurus rhizosphaericola]